MTMNQYLFIHKTKTSMIKIFMKYHFFKELLSFCGTKYFKERTFIAEIDYGHKEAWSSNYSGGRQSIYFTQLL